MYNRSGKIIILSEYFLNIFRIIVIFISIENLLMKSMIFYGLRYGKILGCK